MQAQLLQTDRLQLSSDDRKTHVVIGRNFLAVTRTAPYGSWESFFPLIVTAASAYAELARPAKLSRIDLRYVNEFQFQQSEVRLADYFNFYPMVGDELDFEWTSFITGVAGTVGSNGDRLRLELTSVEPGGEGSAVLLEINCFSSDLKEFGSDTLEGWLNNAHRHIEDTFQGCMTEALRNQVGARPRA